MLLKRTVLVIATLSIILTINVAAQNILIVDTEKPTPTGTNYFTSLQAAINASDEGDIIHFLPSDNDQEGVVISGKSNLTIIGPGFYTHYETKDPDGISFISNLDITSSSNILIKGVRFIGAHDGLVISGTEENPSSNIIIAESHISRLTAKYVNGLIIVNSRLYNKFEIGFFSSNVNIRNNIITGERLVNNVHHSTFRNNLFVGSVMDFEFKLNSFQNNIFANVTPNFVINGLPPVSFKNNFLTTDIYPDSESDGTGNIVQDVPLTDIFIDPAINDTTIWEPRWLLTPKLSAIINGGDDGTDIGPTGGTEPLKRTMFSLPAIYDIMIPLSVKEGEDIEVTIKAKGN